MHFCRRWMAVEWARIWPRPRSPDLSSLLLWVKASPDWFDTVAFANVLLFFARAFTPAEAILARPDGVGIDAG